MKAFQTLFPPLSPHTITLSSARRVVLISYNAECGTVDWRHYRIAVKPFGVSRRVRKVLDGSALDLGSEKDIADFVLRRRGAASDGYESALSDASSAAGDDGDAAVDLADDYVGRNNKKGQKRAVRLDEIGPRIELRLVKITEGIPGKPGAVIYHQFGVWLSSSFGRNINLDDVQLQGPRPKLPSKRRNILRERSCGSKGEQSKSAMSRRRRRRWARARTLPRMTTTKRTKASWRKKGMTLLPWRATMGGTKTRKSVKVR
jgi:hypothetical protein